MMNEFNNLYEFAEFRFDGKRGKLWQNSELVLLSPKASELLALLLERNGEFVSKEEIFEKVWADTFVEDGVLTQNIYTLRKVLGKDADKNPIIENKTRLGYRITVAIEKKENSNGNVSAPLISVKPSKTRLILTLAAISILTALVGLFAYRFFLPETIISTSRLEKIRIQKITDTANIAFPTISPDGNLTAYVRNSSIYIKDLNTSTETKLDLANVKRFGFMQFSADGKFLYLRNRASYFLPADIMKVSRFGGEAVKIAENVWSNGFSFSPDEKQIAFARIFPNENRHALVLKNLENGAETELLSINSPEVIRIRTSPSFSSDGAKIAFVVDLQNQDFERIVIYDLKTKETENLSFKNFTQVEQILWIPKKNALLASAREERVYQIWEISVADRKTSRITNDLNNYFSMTISADGKKLLTTQNNFFTNLWMFEGEELTAEKQMTFGISNRDGYSGIDYLPNGEIVYATNENESGALDIWRINPANNERRQLTNNAGKRNENPAVSPDGKFIYFASDRAGKSAIWQIEEDGENPKQITFGETVNDFFPQLSPDGNWLYFLRKTGKTSAVFRKSLAENREEQLTQTDKLSPANFLSLSPDGKYLAFQHLTEKIQSDNPQQVHQVAFIETENPNNLKFFNLGGRIPQIFWTADGKFFDYVIPVNDNEEIRRQSFFEEKPPQTIKIFSKERIIFILHAPDNKTLIARGRLQNDAVLLTNFE